MGKRGLRVARRTMLLSLVPAAALLAPGHAATPEDHSGLTRESYRRNCLLCHSQAAPEGVSPEILAGLTPVPGLRPADLMSPTIRCQRRCDACKRPADTVAGR